MTGIRRLSGDEAVKAIPALSDVLIDCVHGGASVGFLPPLGRDRAEAFWQRIATVVAAGNAILLAAEDGQRIVGTVQVQFAQPENQPHRADIAKMLVRSDARRRGLGARLMNAAEYHAREAGKRLLVLDTQTGGDAWRLYQRLGWQRVGDIPDFALLPAGRSCATTMFYKQISGAPDGVAAEPRQT